MERVLPPFFKNIISTFVFHFLVTTPKSLVLPLVIQIVSPMMENAREVDVELETELSGELFSTGIRLDNNQTPDNIPYS